MKTTVKQLISAVCIFLAVASVNTYAADEPKFSSQTSMETILFTPELRKVMAKHVPDLMSNPEIDQASVISLGELASYVPDQLTDEVIKAIVDDLNGMAK